MSKGDYVYVLIRTGEGNLGKEMVTADQAGRKIETEWTTEGRGNWFKVTLLTRGGTPISVKQFPVTEIAAIEIRTKEV